MLFRIQSAVWKSEALSGFAKSRPALCAYQFLAFVQAQLAEGGTGRVIDIVIHIDDVTSKIPLNYGDDLHL